MRLTPRAVTATWGLAVNRLNREQRALDPNGGRHPLRGRVKLWAPAPTPGPLRHRRLLRLAFAVTGRTAGSGRSHALEPVFCRLRPH